MSCKSEQIVKDLRTWADFLERVHDGNFDIATWMHGYATLDPKTMDGSCGTVACAGGWATAIPEFKERSLGVQHDGVPAFGHSTGSHALKKFFGVSYLEMSGITHETQYVDEKPTRENAIKRIRQLAQKYEDGEGDVDNGKGNI